MAINKFIFNTKRHAIHPTSPQRPKVQNAAISKEPYGSWCSPDDKSSTSKITPEYKSRCRQTTSSPCSSKLDEIKEDAIELAELPTPTREKSISIKSSLTEDRTDAEVETPQSPIPSSPSRGRPWKGFPQLPAAVDPFVPIDPQGRSYISWLLLVTCCYSYNAWCIALRATFPYQNTNNTPTWMVLDYTCDVIYIIDVALVKPRLMFLHDGFWVDDAKETRNNYRRKLQYKYDVVSLLPLDLLYIYFGPQKVILRLPRLLKLQTFWEFHQAMDRILKSPYVVRIGKTLFYIFYLIHLNACAYYAMSAYEGLGSNGWVYDDEGNAYIRCFYFATKTATSIGKNPKPENNSEYLFMTAAWLMGVFVFALLIGQIRDIIATATRARTEYRKSVDGCTRYLRRLNTPSELQRRVSDWFTYTWGQQRCFDESKILNSLPYNMKRDVALAVHMNTLSKVQLFRDCSSSLLRELVLQLRPLACLPRDVVVRRGDVGHHMYIIKSGECCVMSQDETEVVATLREGSVFGEISLLGIDGLRRRTATVRSRGYSSLFALSRADLEGALNQHRRAAHVLRRRADQLIRENAARQAQQRLAARPASVLRNRRLSSASSNESSLTVEGRRQRSASALSRRRLSVLSENKPQDCSTSVISSSSAPRAPPPAIVLSTD